MKIVKIEREVAHKIFVGGFETIQPTLRMTALLDEGDDYEKVLAMLDEVLTKEWSKVAVHELRLVAKRRGGNPIENDQVPDLMQAFKMQLK